ncbi:MAG: hypothetical protein HOP29_10455 [Phycisphaerales bacterium]|nr:hypothetical protein [Phycisphaerales bacterium]
MAQTNQEMADVFNAIREHYTAFRAGLVDKMERDLTALLTDDGATHRQRELAGEALEHLKHARPGSVPDAILAGLRTAECGLANLTPEAYWRGHPVEGLKPIERQLAEYLDARLRLVWPVEPGVTFRCTLDLNDVTRAVWRERFTQDMVNRIGKTASHLSTKLSDSGFGVTIPVSASANDDPPTLTVNSRGRPRPRRQ